MNNPVPFTVTCRQCGHIHQATICNVCKVPTPHAAVIKPTTNHRKEIHHARS